ncbi:MAG: serine/threonine protein kinase [Polyangiaceae bacterium]|nr:serine/threonine protein kinase [Polyangiaceae bacterium]
MFVCPECGQCFQAPGQCPSDGNPLSDNLTEPLLGQMVGSYRIAALLGVGGMGRVYKGVHPQIGSRVAIKVLSMECAHHPALVQRFFAEARSVNVIRHESIVNIVDLSTLSDGRPYIVMEYLDGQSLSEVIRERSPLPVGGVMTLMFEVLDALAAAHQAGIVHRDLKPDNIFVTAQGRPKVLDFGIAKLRPELGAGSDATRTGSILGTPHYMSPEQAQGQHIDHRSDIYALGIILFELLTGARPFEAPTLYSLLDMHVKQPPPPPTSVRRDLLPVFDQVVFRALAKRPEQRYQTAGEMKQALELASQSLPQGSWAGLGARSSGRPPVGNVTPHYGRPPTVPSTLGGQIPSGTSPSFGGHPPGTMGGQVMSGGYGVGPTGGSLHLSPPAAPERSSPIPYILVAVGGFVLICAMILVFSFGLSLVGQANSSANQPVVNTPTADPDDPDDDPGLPVANVPGLPTGTANTRFDVTSEASTAFKAAEKVNPGLKVALITANGVKSDGMIDMSASMTNSATFQFVNASTCVLVSATQFGNTTIAMTRSDCSGTPVRPPRCSLANVMKRAFAQTKASPTALGIVTYQGNKAGEPRWSVTLGVLSHAEVPDDC